MYTTRTMFVPSQRYLARRTYTTVRRGTPKSRRRIILNIISILIYRDILHSLLVYPEISSAARREGATSYK